MDHITLNRYPYFFRYRYKKAKNDYKKYIDEYTMCSYNKFRRSLEETLAVENPTEEERKFIEGYWKYVPLLCTDSVMNRLCRYMESVKAEVLRRCKEELVFDGSVYKHPDYAYTPEQYAAVSREIRTFISAKRFLKQTKYAEWDDTVYLDEIRQEYAMDYDILADRLYSLCGNIYVAVNCAVDFYYKEKQSANKELLWGTFGRYMYENLVRNHEGPVTFPMRDPDGEIVYQGNRYTEKEIAL